MSTVYTISNPVPMGAQPATNGIVQKFLTSITNTGDATFAPDGFVAAPVLGLGGLPLQGNEIIAGGVVTLVSYVGELLNGGDLCWILFDCTDGAQQVGAATASNQAPQSGQVANGSLETATAEGSANAITASFPFSPTGYATGQKFTIIASETNTSSVTAVITLGGQSEESIPLVKGNNVPLAPGDFPAGYPGEFIYSATFSALIMNNPATGVATPGSPAGTIITYGGPTIPTGYLALPTAATNISRATYSGLFAALTLQTTGTTSSGSTSVSAVGTTTNVKVGYPISGPGIPIGTTVAAVGSGTIALSSAATASATGAALVIAPWGVGDGTTTFGLPYLPAGYALSQVSTRIGLSTVGENLAHTHTLNSVFQAAIGTQGGEYHMTDATTLTTNPTGGPANLAASVAVQIAIKY